MKVKHINESEIEIDIMKLRAAIGISIAAFFMHIIDGNLILTVPV